MLFFYVRHGDPIYTPNQLTPLGKRQAEAVAKRLAMHGIDEIYASTSQRAIETAQPTCEILKKEMTLLDFANADHAWMELAVVDNGRRGWLFHNPKFIKLFAEKSVRDLGDKWFEHPELEQYDLGKGIERIYEESDKFFASLGYEHDRYTGRYKVVEHSDKRVALFAHQGFGLAFLSCLLDIPYPILSTHVMFTHSSMTVFEFRETDGIVIPNMLTMSNDSHLYADYLPTKYQNRVYF
jgi:probable phosphoglycerate mutase